ncbi:MAG: FMN-binding protein [Candidatus Omnitrophota bacterium]
MKKLNFIFLFLFCLSAGWASADELISVDEALSKIYKDATRFEAEQIVFSEDELTRIAQQADISFNDTHAQNIIRFAVFQENQILGWAFEDTVIGKWGPIHYLVGLNQHGEILQVVILGFYEIRGKPASKKRFLKQYIGKDINHPLRLRRDIDGVSGATITSRSLTDGVRKIVHIFNLIQISK